MKLHGMLMGMMIAVVGACAGDESSVPRCTPGASAACTCPTGQSGAQVCGADGAYGACVCQSLQTDGGAQVDVLTDAGAVADTPASEDVTLVTDTGSLMDAGMPGDAEMPGDAGVPMDAAAVDAGPPPADRPPTGDAPGVSCVLPGLCNVTKIVLTGNSLEGGRYGCALMNNEQVYCWGRNSTPTGLVERLTDFDDIVALTSLTGVLCYQRRATPGRVYCPTTTAPPEVVPDVIDVVQLPLSGSRSGRTSDGRIIAWPMPSSGLGAENRGWVVPDIAGAVDVLGVGNNIRCGRRGDESVLCWVQTPGTRMGVTSEVPELRGARATLMTNLTQGCMLRADGTVACHGPNTHGELGIGSVDRDSHPAYVTVPGLTGIVQITGGTIGVTTVTTTRCARSGDGRVWCWGDNNFGQLGDGTTTNRPLPTLVAGLSDAMGVQSDGKHTCAIRAIGRVVCWGDPTQGTSTAPLTMPTAVNGLPLP